MTKVVDYSFNHPSPEAIKAAGYDGAVRYLSPLGDAKVIKKPEWDALRAEGLSVTLVWEWYEQRALNGWNAGVADARRAVAMARALGADSGACIYYVLEDPTRIPQAKWPQAEDYASGVKAVHEGVEFTVGGYGGQSLVENCIFKGLIQYGWQVGGWSQTVSPVCHLYQQLGYVLGDTADRNACLQDDWGQSPRPIIEPIPAPVPEEEEEEMALSIVAAKDGDGTQYVTDLVTFKTKIANPDAWAALVWNITAAGGKLYHQTVENPIQVPAEVLKPLPVTGG